MKIKIATPDVVIDKIKEIPSIYKITFIASVIFAAVVHGMGFINFFFNEDSINRWNFFVRVGFSARGAWFIDVIRIASTWGYSVPWIHGVQIVIALGLMCAFIVKILDIKSIIFALLSSFLIIAFPAMAFTFVYNFTMHIFMWGMFFAVFAVYLTERYKFGFIVGALSLMLSLALYQAYIGLTIGLILILIMKYLYRADSSYLTTLKYSAKFLLMGILGGIFYYISVRISFAILNIQATSYAGLDTMGQVPIRDLPSLIIGSFQGYFQFFFFDRFLTNTNTIQNLYYIFFALIVLNIFIAIWRRKVKLSKIFGILGILIILPIGLNIIEIIAHQAFIHPLMHLQFILTFPLLFSLIDDNLNSDMIEKECENFKNVINLKRWLVVIVAVMLCSQFHAHTGVYYLKLYVYRERTTSFYTRLLTHIETTDGYRQNIPLIIHGFFGEGSLLIDDHRRDQRLGFRPSIVQFPEITGDTLSRGQFVGFTSPRFQRGHTYFPVWMGVYFPSVPADRRAEILSSEEFLNMPAWPIPGSVMVIDDVMVVRLSR